MISELESNNHHSCESIYNIKVMCRTVDVGSDLFNDLEVFHPYDNQSYDTTLHNIFRKHARTLGGQKVIDDILANPQYDINILETRKYCLSKVIGKENEQQLFSLEQDLLWLFADREDTVDQLLNSIYFSNFFLRRLNHSETFLTSYNFYKICISPSLGLVSPLLYIIIPFIVLKFKFGNELNISFHMYIKLLWKSIIASESLFANGGKMLNRMKMISYILTLCFYFQGIFNSVQISYTTNKVIKYISDKINNSFRFMKHALLVINDNESILNECKNAFLMQSSDDIDTHLVDKLNTYTPYSNFTVFSHFGKQLKLFKAMNKATIQPLVNTFYLLDAMCAINTVKSSLHLCTPLYLNYTGVPVCSVNKAWYIHLDPDHSVRNDCNIKNSIITGPNAGGKSTFIKMMCTNILLAQTCCICAASSMKLTPFYMVNSQINIPDCKGHESLFEAEMNRCLFNLTHIEKYMEYPCFLVMDEIFNSTNVVEAISGAYAILENISRWHNTICIITTHLHYLTNLRKTTNFECLCMSVNVNESGIEYPYKLKSGVSRQYIALELLKEKGFDETIISRALDIKAKFVK